MGPVAQMEERTASIRKVEGSSPSGTTTAMSYSGERMIGNVRRGWKRLLNDGGILRCHWCLELLTLESVSVDHLLPLSLGGDSQPENLTHSCKPCNFARGNLMGPPHPGKRNNILASGRYRRHHLKVHPNQIEHENGMAALKALIKGYEAKNGS